MGLLELIKQKMDDFSSSEQKVANTIIDHPEYVENETISRLAQYADTSTSAVLRFCQSLGYNGFKDFKFAFTHSLESNTNQEDTADDIVESIAENTRRMKKIPGRQISQLAHEILNASSIYIYGLYYSSLAAMNLSMRLEDLGIRSFVSTDVVSGTHRTNTLNADSLLITFSVWGDDRSYRNILDSFPTSHHYFYLITSAAHSRVANYYDEVYVLPDVEHLHGDLNEHMAQFIFVEQLIKQVRQLKFHEKNGED